LKAVVCGGGAAGMICAIEAAKAGLDVTLIEKNNKLGKKLYITGKGRCNLTNTADKQTFFNQIVSNPKFLYSAINTFSNTDTMIYFEKLGVPIIEERGGRVFPASNKSSDIIRALEKELNRLGVKVIFGESAIDIKTDGSKAVKLITDKSEYYADRFVLATGGASYKATGSTGDGYTLAQRLGHTVVSIAPALTGIELKSAVGVKITFPMQNLPSAEGLSLKNVQAAIITKNGKQLKSEQGEMLFTDTGVSGPIILTLSSHINRLNPEDLWLTIDLKPALSPEVLDNRILRDFEEIKNKMYKNSLAGLLPNKLIAFIICLSGIHPEKSVNTVTRAERASLVRLLKNLTFEIKSLQDIDRAVVTAGGIDTREINPSDMRSKLISNLAFAGEIIDVDALTGGFNLQIAFSTGYLAGVKLKH
jgi:predicted Rossmann fold flavoprotein